MPAHIAVEPVIAEGCEGMLEAPMTTVAAAEVPQALLAATLTLPPVPVGVTVIALLVDVPLQPVGKDQV